MLSEWAKGRNEDEIYQCKLFILQSLFRDEPLIIHKTSEMKIETEVADQNLNQNPVKLPLKISQSPIKVKMPSPRLKIMETSKPQSSLEDSKRIIQEEVKNFNKVSSKGKHDIPTFLFKIFEGLNSQ